MSYNQPKPRYCHPESRLGGTKDLEILWLSPQNDVIGMTLGIVTDFDTGIGKEKQQVGFWGRQRLHWLSVPWAP